LLALNELKPTASPLRWVPPTWFAMGLPNVMLSGTALTVLYRNLGYTDSEIALWTGVIVLPWSFKPLWGPFLEMFRSRRFYIYITQLLAGICFALSALSLYTDHFFPISIVLFFLLAFFGATQDMAADGMYLAELSAKDQARWVGWQGTFYNVSKVFSNGGMVFLAGSLIASMGNVKAWSIVLGIYALVMLMVGIYSTRVLPRTEAERSVKSGGEVWATLVDVIRSFFQKPYVWGGIAFITLYRFAEGQAMKITPLFFLAKREAGGLGLTEAQVGLLTGVYGTIAFILGSLLAGYLVSNKGLTRRMLLTLCALFNLPFAAYVYLAWFLPVDMLSISLAVSVEYFGYGFGFIGIILFIMQQLAPGKYPLAHYAFGSAITYLGFTAASMISGYISDRYGYANFFLWVLVSTLPAFLMTALVPLKKPESTDNSIHSA
jgi:PAT family beta-lactamase induction signal transducer AmpG